VNCPPFPISLSFWVELVGACNSIVGLIMTAKTQFATAFLTLKSLYKNKDALKSLFNSQEWTGNPLCKITAGLQVRDVVLSVEFWNSIEDCLRATAPLLIV
jgi:hypothetical protein